MKTFFLLLSLLPLLHAEPLFREDFRDNVEAHIPVTNDDLTSDFLTLKRFGPGADQLKLSYHPEIENDPHYVWNGECQGPTLLAFDFKKALDLTSPGLYLTVGSKNIGKSKLHLALKVGKQWFVRKEPLANQNEWNRQIHRLLGSTWLTLDPETIAIGKDQQAPDLKTTTAIGFVSPIKPNRSKDCTRLNWFELTNGPLPKTLPLATPLPDPNVPKKTLPKNGFLEPETPFLRSALVLEHEGEERFVRRGVLVPLGFKNRWACFDPDILEWVVVWEAPEGKAPITYDSMAGVSFPDKKAKAKQAPRLVGKILLVDPEGAPPKEHNPGPLPENKGHWIGVSLRGDIPVLTYRIGAYITYEFITNIPDKTFSLVTKKENLTSPVTWSKVERTSFWHKGRGFQHPYPAPFPKADTPATPAFPATYSVKNPRPEQKAPFTIRSINFPQKSGRPVRATDIAFRKNGVAYLSTLDGDIWQIEEIARPVSRWTRIATGLFEPMAIEVDSEDRLFTLGRDQITELIDLNGDGFIDEFRNASDAFLQTLHTRDYATSLAIGADGSFLIAKGGLFEPEKKGIENELSEHRGTVLHITPDGQTATVLADGLRLPYVGLRKDGTVFASDQQGHYIPSSPLHLISGNRPFLGFEPTNFEKREPATPPLLWYPYQANRSAAAFCTTSAKAFPDLPDTFLQVSWNGRLFAIETPENGQAFSWQLPLQLDFPALNGATHPQSGRLYVVGLGISGYKPTTPQLVGLASIEQSHPFPTPRTLEVEEDSITVTFNRPLANTETLVPGNPALRLFNVKRTPKYGSGHYLWNDKPGEHHFAAQQFNLSPDRQSFHANFAPLHRSDLFDLTLNVGTESKTFPLHLYTRPHHLSPASQHDLQKLAEAEKSQPELLPGQANLGKPLFTQYACSGCHSLTGENLTGPPLNKVASRLNAAKLRQSILNPTAEITEDYEAAMPSFEGVIPPQDLAHLLTYLQTLK